MPFGRNGSVRPGCAQPYHRREKQPASRPSEPDNGRYPSRELLPRSPCRGVPRTGMVVSVAVRHALLDPVLEVPFAAFANTSYTRRVELAAQLVPAARTRPSTRIS